MADRIIEIADLDVQYSQIVMSIDVLWSDGGDGVKVIDGVLRSAGLPQNRPVFELGRGVVGVPFDSLAADADRARDVSLDSPYLGQIDVSGGNAGVRLDGGFDMLLSFIQPSRAHQIRSIIDVRQ